MRIQAPIAVTGQLRGSVRYNSRRLQPQYAFRPIRLPVEPRPMPTDVLDRFETFERGRWYSGWLKSVLPIALFDAKTTE
jgi:type III restriction enzyme